MPFPAPGFFTANPTGGEGLQALDDLVARARQQIGADGVEDRTIASGGIVPTAGSVRLFGEAASADTLTTVDLVNFADGQLLELRIGDANQPVTVQHAASPAAGEIELVGGLDLVLNDLSQRLVLQVDGTKLVEWARFGRELGTTVDAGDYEGAWGPGTPGAHFWKDTGGTVQLFNFAAHPSVSGSSSNIFTLPPGYRPASSVVGRFPVHVRLGGVTDTEINFVRVNGALGFVGWERPVSIVTPIAIVIDMSAVRFRAEG